MFDFFARGGPRSPTAHGQAYGAMWRLWEHIGRTIVGKEGEVVFGRGQADGEIDIANGESGVGPELARLFG